MQNVTDMWAHWIPPESRETMRYGGYYDALIEPGLRMIALNTMYCDYKNFWLLLDIPDPAGQLEWMSSVLEKSESAGEKVWISGHIPPGSGGCHPNYTLEYYRLILQYNQTITGQFWGHTHDDEFGVFHDLETNLIPMSVFLTAPAMTSYGGRNPSVRIFEYDSNSKILLDYSQFYLNLSEANVPGNSPSIRKEYSFREAYGVPDMSPLSFDDLTKRFVSNDSLFQEFYLRIPALGPMNSGICNGSCKASEICSLLNILPSQYQVCFNATFGL